MIQKTTPQGTEYLTQWEDVEQETRDIFFRWTAMRQPDVKSLTEDPIWGPIYKSTVPNTSPYGEVGQPATTEELDIVLNEAPGGKAPGPSGVPYDLLRALGRKGRRAFLGIINRCLLQGVTPKGWLHHVIHPLPKGEWTGDFNKSRPIALLETARKILEQIINKRLKKVLTDHPESLPGGNYGFVPGDGIEGALGTVR
jgi:hypothetical protein